jgi:multiple sugar transport system permease protein
VTGPSTTLAPAGPPLTGAPATSVPRTTGLQRAERRAGAALALPAAAFFLVFWLLPFGYALYLSFTDYELGGTPRWVGLDNYDRLLHSPGFSHSLQVTAIYTVCAVVPTLIIALLLAIPLSKPGRLNRWLRAAMLVPAVMPIVAAAVLWQVIYADGGMADTLTDAVGAPNADWLTDPDVALWALLVMVIWKYVGLYVIIFVAGLQSIPPSVYEAAALDAAGPVRTLFQITLPLLRRTLVFVLVIAVAGAVQSFAPAFLLTQGGPVNATQVLPIFLYQNAFTFGRMGYASAMAVVLMLLLLIVAAGQFSLLRQREPA